MLIRAGTSGERLPIADVCADLGIDREILADDVAVLNVINFGGGTYVLYAELGESEIEVDPEAYGDSFDRPARLLPLEAKALVAAIDLFGNHLPQANLTSVREKIVEALGRDPSREGLEITPEHGDSEVISTINDGITGHRVVELDYYKEAEDSFTKREIEPYRLAHGQEGWYVGCWDRSRKATRHFRLDRVRSAKLGDETFEPREEVAEELAAEDWLSDGEVIGAEVARVWVSPERARWLREERTVVEELADGAAVVELPFAGKPYLVREILRGAGDMVVLEPEDAREAVRKALAA
jgi:proteasome accessory factor C